MLLDIHPVTPSSKVVNLGPLPLTQLYVLHIAFKACLKDLTNVQSYLISKGIDFDTASPSVGAEANDVLSDYVELRAPVSAFNSLFSIKLSTYECLGKRYISFEGVAKVPIELGPYVRGIFGLDTFTSTCVSRDIPQDIVSRSISRGPRSSFTSLDVVDMYNFPSLPSTSESQKVGVISLEGGYLMSDITTYLQSLGILRIPKIVNVVVDGALRQSDIHSPLRNDAATLETTMDLEVIASLLPTSTIIVYIAPATTTGLYKATRRAVNDGCKVISISWGMPEKEWNKQELNAFDVLLSSACTQGVTVVAASGDRGATEKGNVLFPSTSPWVLACGGTMVDTVVKPLPEVVKPLPEVVWQTSQGASTGGVSRYFAKPQYQCVSTNSVSTNSVLSTMVKRGVPDVAALACDYKIIYHGQEKIVEGTSVATPIWAALIARINLLSKTSVGHPHPLLYSSPNAFNDVVTGSNGKYSATSGWNACTGLGTPRGIAITRLWVPTYQLSPQELRLEMKAPHPFIAKKRVARVENARDENARDVAVRSLVQTAKSPPVEGCKINPKIVEIRTRHRKFM